jgi:hypothetical protein
MDDPLDPANRYFSHASVESSEMKNIYDGKVTTDAQGAAVVRLPEWFETLNTDFRYQLTVVGQFAQAMVEQEIANGQFTIRTDKPNVKVCWQVTGVRHDPWASAHPLEVTTEKPEKERGYYLHPELYGAPAAQQVVTLYRPKLVPASGQLRTPPHGPALPKLIRPPQRVRPVTHAAAVPAPAPAKH